MNLLAVSSIQKIQLRTCILLNYFILSEGYSMAVATVSGNNYSILGAPRYEHQGQVIVSQANQYKLLDSPMVVHIYFGVKTTQKNTV